MDAPGSQAQLAGIDGLVSGSELMRLQTCAVSTVGVRTGVLRTPGTASPRA